ncbi:MAG: hypothetical protein GPOALKHO_001438 [Sodalis sp.]|nr:MAG: hypothetical protein GPOALKHO_001438 [Sodalis sp.]
MARASSIMRRIKLVMLSDCLTSISNTWVSSVSRTKPLGLCHLFDCPHQLVIEEAARLLVADSQPIAYADVFAQAGH